MAGRGSAPKAPEVRRNHHQPRAGEWVEIGPLAARALPDLPPDDPWTPRTRAAWEAWRSDPVTALYGSADLQLALDLAYLYESWVLEPTASLAGEVRQRQDSLGLTPKGRQDRRWRLTTVDIPPAALPRAKSKANDRRARLSVVK